MTLRLAGMRRAKLKTKGLSQASGIHESLAIDSHNEWSRRTFLDREKGLDPLILFDFGPELLCLMTRRNFCICVCTQYLIQANHHRQTKA